MKHISLKRLIPSLFVSIMILTSAIAVVQPKQADAALKGSDFVAGNIIDGSLFYQGNAMSTDQIQKFLNAKVPTCDTNGTQPSSRWSSSRNRNYTRAEWGTVNGNPPPFKCLKDFTQNTPTMNADTYCPNKYTGGTKTAAQIIRDVSVACNFSQKAMLVLLQKEQSFITDDWPWKVQYTKTTGYGCPDTALNKTVDANQNGCYDEYEGFFKQIYYAARQFRRYALQPELFNFRSGRTSYVQYNPNASCGGKNVAMQNSATAALYNYTPYVPNQAALDNLYGTGNSCSAYGNRNFWRLYNDWFGSTKPSIINMPKTGREVYRMFSTKYGKHFFTPYMSEVKQLDSKSTYKLEGIAFQQPPAGSPNRVGVFRLKKGEKWFWTIHVSERNNLVNKHGYKLEGTAFTALTGASTNPNKIAVYRLFNSRNGAHLFTTSNVERDAVAAKAAWKYEGVAWHMLSE